MRLITIEEKIAVVEKAHKANVWLATSYPGTKREVCCKLDRYGVTVFIHADDLSVQQHLPVEPWGFTSTADEQLAAVHSALDAIIEECNEKSDRFTTGAMEAAGT